MAERAMVALLQAALPARVRVASQLKAELAGWRFHPRVPVAATLALTGLLAAGGWAALPEPAAQT
jgi:hypothetical protein